jgi:hypothetical protein
MKKLILPPVDFAATIARILEDYLPEDCLIHTLTDQQVSDMYNDLTAGCEEAYEEASDKAEEAIERAYMQDEGIDPFDMPTSDEEPMGEKLFCATEVVQGAIADIKSANKVVSEKEVPIKYIYR